MKEEKIGWMELTERQFFKMSSDVRPEKKEISMEMSGA
jgi:hypothetical protein